jgi:hypothetical protein
MFNTLREFFAPADARRPGSIDEELPDIGHQS